MLMIYSRTVSTIFLVIFFVNLGYSEIEGIRFYIEKDLKEFKSNPPSAEVYEAELNRILYLCKENFLAIDSTTAKVYDQLSDFHFDQHHFKKSFNAKKEELLILEGLKKKKAIADCYTRLAQIAKWNASFYTSKEYHLKALDLKRAFIVHSQYDNYLGLAESYHQLGEYQLQKAYAQYALEVAKSPEEIGRATILLAQGTVSLKEYETGELLVKEVMKVGNENNLPDLLGGAYSLKGWIELEKEEAQNNSSDNFRRSIANTLKAIEYFKKSDGETTERQLAFNYSTVSNLYARLNDFDESMHYGRIAIKTLSDFYNDDYHQDMGTLYSNFGSVHGRRYSKNRNNETISEGEKIADLDNIIDYEEKAIRCYLDNMNMIDPMSVTEQDLIGINLKKRCLKSYYIIALSNAHKYIFFTKRKDDLQRAQKSEDLAIKLIDMMRAEMSDEEGKIFWRADTRKHYDTAIEFADWEGDINKMIYYMEKSKSVLLLDELNFKEAQKLIPSELSQRELELRELVALNNEDKPFFFNQYNKFIDSLEQEFPAYYAYKFDTKTPSLRDIQMEMIDDSTSILMYHLTRDSLYTIKIEKESAELITAPKPKDLSTSIDSLLSLINNKDSLEFMNNFESFLTVSNDLYKLLIKPAHLKTPNVIVVGDGQIDYVPFDVLVSDANLFNPRYLIHDHTFSKVSSISILSKKLSDSKKSFSNFLMLSPESFQNNGLINLSYSNREVEILKKIKGAKILNAHSATYNNFLDLAHDYDVIHLSSHSGVNDLGTPWVAFQDSVVDLSEVYKLNLNASLVTLSSCKSHDGNYNTGEGINSLARAFLFADASAVVASYWNLNEVSGLKIFNDFYANLKASNSKPSALRDAKLKYIKEHPYKSPYHWASLVCIGNPSQLESPAHLDMPWIVVVLFAIMFLAIGAVKIKP